MGSGRVCEVYGMIIKALGGPSCKLSLARISAELSFTMDRVWHCYTVFYMFYLWKLKDCCQEDYLEDCSVDYSGDCL